MIRLLMLFAFTTGFLQPLLAKKKDLFVELNDGRQLSYAIYGDSLGVPVFYFHGGQESRLSASFMHETATQLGIKIIAPDRPGIGKSSPHPGRSFPDWADDVNQLADALHVQQFSVFGLSGGAPHVLACAQQIPDRLLRVGIVAGAAPYDYKGTKKGMWFPVKLVHWFASWEKDKQLRKFIQRDYETLRDKPEKRVRQLQKYLPKPDRELLKTKPELAWDFIEGSLESYHQGIDGVVQEWKMYVSNWDITLSEIKKPIELWYGDKDKMSPAYRGYYYKANLPDAELHLLANEGHFSLIRNHLESILQRMKA